MNYFSCECRWLNIDCSNFLSVNAVRQLLIEASRELTFITIWIQINLKAPFDEDCKSMPSVSSLLLFLLLFKHCLQLSSKSFISTWLRIGYRKCLFKKSSLVIPGLWIKWLTWQCGTNTKKQPGVPFVLASASDSHHKLVVSLSFNQVHPPIKQCCYTSSIKGNACLIAGNFFPICKRWHGYEINLLIAQKLWDTMEDV